MLGLLTRGGTGLCNLAGPGPGLGEWVDPGFGVGAGLGPGELAGLEPGEWEGKGLGVRAPVIEGGGEPRTLIFTSESAPFRLPISTSMSIVTPVSPSEAAGDEGTNDGERGRLAVEDKGASR